jgi:hypothetical protein
LAATTEFDVSIVPGPMVICRTHQVATAKGTLGSEQNLQLMAQRIGIDQRLDALQGTRIMDTDRKLGDIAANLDDMSHTLAALKDAVETGGRRSEAAIDELQREVEEASGAIDDVVDPEQPA